MINNRRINSSRRIYAALLNLFPKDHRTKYGSDMLQVFTDQCRETCQDGKRLSLIPLWLRTLGDLMVNVFKEHVSDPQSAVGLVEAAPNSPLPWKGVFLVLLPGLIFFVCQVAQLNGEDWFFTMVYRAAYVLIIPVLAIWIWKRKFPIWGLVPLGLLFKTLLSFFEYRFQFLALDYSNPIMFWLNEQTKSLFPILIKQTITITFLLSIIGLLWLAKRRSSISHAAWACMSIYCMLFIIDFVWNSHNIGLQMGTKNMPDHYLSTILENFYYSFYNYGGYLVLILLGTLLAKRHGRLAVLLPLGFLLPTIIYGRVSNDWPDLATPEFGFMLSVAAAALVYRFSVALAAPLWIIRSATGKMQRRAGVISMVALILIQLVFNIVLFFYNGWNFNQFDYALIVIFEQLRIGMGLALAIALYGTVPNLHKVQKEMDMILEVPSYP